MQAESLSPIKDGMSVSNLEKAKANGSSLLIQNDELFPGRFEKCVECRISEINSSTNSIKVISVSGRQEAVIINIETARMQIKEKRRRKK